MPVESHHFGSWLKSRREGCGLSLAELSRATKIKQQMLELIEADRWGDLPAPVFVRGFVSAYARQVGADEREALERLSQTACLPGPGAGESRLPAKVFVPVEDDGADPAPAQRRFGVVMVVLLILVVATLTLSLLLRHGGAAGRGIS